MSKDCGNHGLDNEAKLRRICGGIVFLVVILGFTVLLVWAILRPTKPRFILQDVTVFAFNVSSPNLLTTNFQITAAARNPNSKIGIYYDRLHVYATYRNQQITLRTAIPPTYQGHKEDDVWSPFVYGTSVPIAPYNAVALSDEQSRGFVMLTVRADGRVRWKVGTFITGRYHIHVRCPAYINLWNKAAGTAVGDNAVKYTLVTKCSVNV
ncbi:PREDICTED: NDR1/HIN1-like protein 12 [Tarenaya hassleriana]|uniref:NDR1/HIN1-like protein 12 n=1 Tax=Tarenaya hassleriana TaxID=28532 RepID=UPI00053CA479|nr:PREDICTED: NDR1/HIN1-like protein 12 [Tarenaya hassleriana]